MNPARVRLAFLAGVSTSDLREWHHAPQPAIENVIRSMAQALRWRCRENLGEVVAAYQRHLKRLRQRRSYQRRRAKVLGRMREYRERNAAAIKARDKARREANPERVRMHNRKNYKRHKAAFVTRAKLWIAANRDKHNGYTKKTSRRYVAELHPVYLKHKVARQIPRHKITKKHINQKKQELQVCRTKWQFKLLKAGSLLGTSPSPASSPL